MGKKTSNKNIYSLRFFLPALFLAVIASSCNPTKYVPAGETLLAKNHIKINTAGVKEADLVPYIKQKPNKKIFGARFHLGLYNLSNLNKKKWPHSWLRNIGEEPVIYDSTATEKSKEQIKSYVASRGYFDGKVSDSVRTEKRKSEVYYDVKLKSPYTIRNLYYDFADTSIRAFFYFDSVNCLIERGKPYNVDVLQSERSRFERFIKNNGYYGFSGEYINFLVDSTIGNRQVNIVYTVKNLMKVDQFKRITYVPHSKYRIKNIYLYPDFVPKDLLEGGDAYLRSMDTINYNGYYFISRKGSQPLKFDLILQSLYIKPGSEYNITNVEQTQAHLMTLKVYRLVNIFFKELEKDDEDPDPDLSLDCHIQLTLLSQQSFNIEFEGTNSNGNLGGAMNLIYQHKNLFRGAEQFGMKLKGAFEAATTEFRGSRELGFEINMRLPKFFLPFLKKEGLIRNYNPTTNILAAINYQDVLFYTRTIANATFGYNWVSHNYQTHIVNPVQLNYIKLARIDPVFQARIESSSYLAYSYRSVMILGGGYSFIFNNQKIQKKNDYWFLRINAETAGNMLSLVSKIAGLKMSEGSYNLLGLPFAQYIRADLDLRYNIHLNDVSSAVYRGFVGVGIPYGNSVAIPFEKQYFGGGANGIRAWQVRTLGPGTYKDTTKFVNQTADIKIEANAEYRFKLFWILEGALFVDAGNIWTLKEDDSRVGAKFQFKNFIDDIAVGAGTGFRFDLSFVIARIDIGMKLRDPSIPDGSRWLFLNRDPELKRDVFTLVLGIGYPF